MGRFCLCQCDVMLQLVPQQRKNWPNQARNMTILDWIGWTKCCSLPPFGYNHDVYRRHSRWPQQVRNFVVGIVCQGLAKLLQNSWLWHKELSISIVHYTEWEFPASLPVERATRSVTFHFKISRLGNYAFRSSFAWSENGNVIVFAAVRHAVIYIAAFIESHGALIYNFSP